MSKDSAREKTREFAVIQIRKTASIKPLPPLFCHAWDGADVHGNEVQDYPFNTALREAHFALFDMGLNFATGMSEKGKRLMEAREYPTAVENLRNYMFVNDTKVTREQFHQMLGKYVEVVESRAKRVIETHGGRDKALAINWKADHTKSYLVLDRLNDGVWGSRRQWACGETVSRLLAHYSGVHLHPMFAMMLNPTGGIAGPANTSILTADMHSPVIVHAVVHDAFGYVKNFHDVGPGYNYLCMDSCYTRIVSLFKGSNSCYHCQAEGVACARREMAELGTLGNEGRIARREAMVALRRELARDERDREYPKNCLPTVSKIEHEYEKCCNAKESVCGEMMQWILSVGSGMGYFRELKIVSAHATYSRDRRPRRKRSAGAAQLQQHDLSKRHRSIR